MCHGSQSRDVSRRLCGGTGMNRVRGCVLSYLSTSGSRSICVEVESFESYGFGGRRTEKTRRNGR